MKINDMFKKPIARTYQKVVTIGENSDANLSQELDEYVVTRELNKHIASFYSAYKKGIIGHTPNIGVWISGFFGSGKSHFLKILGLLLENRIVDGKPAIDYFIEDEKIKDPIILADMQLAANTPTDVILFDIAAKSEANSENTREQIVNILNKVFNEMQGFYGSFPRLADLERRLSDEGRYEEFKERFQAEHGDTWETSRHDFGFIQDDVVDILVEMDFMSESAARNVCERVLDNYTISPDDFGDRIERYLAKKDKNHHIVFLIDELGQYVGDDRALMLNLQAVTQEMSKRFGGKVWIVVTSQQDIDSVTKVVAQDFSRIQDRFETKLSLSSANADIVIKKRILEKTDVAAKTLRLFYDQNQTIIKNLIVFTDSVEKKLYASATDFEEVYPFVSYQFNLAASILRSVRLHGATGKSSGEGERSMLALFKEAGAAIKKQDLGAICPLYRFYDVLDELLDHSHRSVIIKAYDNSVINPEHKRDEVYAINVLKTLFLIKYVPEIEANVENITSLMVDNIHNDRLALKAQVEAALRVLTQQMLVQKNGSVYVFLTNEEQEINNEIEREDVETSVVVAKAAELIFAGILTSDKYRYPAFNGRYTFSFNQSVDDRPVGNKKGDFSLHIITPWYTGGRDETTLKMRSSQGDEVIVLLPNDVAFLEELRASLKIESFLRRNTSVKLAKYESIKIAKGAEMRERNENATIYLEDALKKATIFVGGDILRVPEKDIKNKINDALERVVKTIYFKLSYIEVAVSDSDIRDLLKDDGSAIRLGAIADDKLNEHAVDDMMHFVSTYSKMHAKLTMKTVKDQFKNAPYGYVDDDIDWLVAWLFKHGNITLNVNGENVSLTNRTANEIFSYLTRKQYLENLMLEERVKVPEREKKAVNNISKELFSLSISSEDEDTMMAAFKKGCENKISQIDQLLPEYNLCPYPGRQILADTRKLLQEIMGIAQPLAFFKSVFQRQDDLRDLADDLVPVFGFFNGPQKDIFKNAVDSLKVYDDSKEYLYDKDLKTVVDKIRAIVEMPAPYDSIYKLPELRETFQDSYVAILENESVPVIETIEEERQRVLDELEKKPYKDEKHSAYTRAFDALIANARASHSIAELRSNSDKARVLKMRYLDEMADKDRKRAEALAKEDPGVKTPPVPYKKIRNIAIKKIARTSSWRLETEDDVEKCLADLRANLVAQLADDTIINIEL